MSVGLNLKDDFTIVFSIGSLLDFSDPECVGTLRITLKTKKA
jgi:hypothetical protein